jgi:uncharacterized repeat protein (TIGR03803 family)
MRKILLLTISIFSFSFVNSQTVGRLYGMTKNGGTSNMGVIFFYDPVSAKDSIVYNFSSATGHSPYGGLIQALDGNLYGMTTFGGDSNKGTIFRFNPTTNAFTTLFNFHDTDGITPYGSLLQAKDSNFYGMAYGGGKHGFGTIFKYTLAGAFIPMFSFDSLDGANPYGNLIQALNGKFYGMTFTGPGGEGILFKFKANGQEIILDSSGNTNQLVKPYGSLFQAYDTNFYGMTSVGGLGNGNIFKCSIAGVLDSIASFDGTNGNSPRGNLIMGYDSNLYGMTWDGGATGYGNIFKCSLSGQKNVIANFNSPNGYAYGSLIQASDSNLYGMTSGSSGHGNIFKCTTSGSLTTLVSFNVTDGAQPFYGNLLEAMSVNIGTTSPGCNSRTLTALVRGGGPGPYTYRWSNGDSTASIDSINSAGTYSVVVTNAKGITIADSIKLLAFDSLTSTISSSNIACMGGMSGSAKLHVSGGITPYTFLWNNGQTDSSIMHLDTGMYKVTITDNAGCISKDSTIIVQPATILKDSVFGTNAKCYTTSDGTAGVAVMGGNTPYTYNWTNGQTTANITGLSAGIYSVTVTDSNGCVVTGKDTISQPVSKLDSVQICMVTADTASKHNIVVWNPSRFFNIDSVKVFYFNSIGSWQMVGEALASAAMYTDTTPGNNPNINTVRYLILGVDSCHNEEIVPFSKWHSTLYINYNYTSGRFSWSSTQYQIEYNSSAVAYYVLYRDSNSTGNWLPVDSVNGNSYTITDPGYAIYPHARWFIAARLHTNACASPHSNQRKNGTTGIQELIDKKKLASIYPNPANDILNIKLSTADKPSIQITDITGRVILESNSSETQNNIVPVNVSALSAGVYFVRIQNGEGLQVIRFVKQ